MIGLLYRDTDRHASWLNLIEVFFSKMNRGFLRHIRAEPKHELIERRYYIPTPMAKYAATGHESLVRGKRTFREGE